MHGVPFPAVTFLCRTMEVSISTTMLFYSIKFFRAKNCTLPPIFSCPVVYASFFRRLKFYKTSTLLHFRQSHLKKKILTYYNLIGDFLKKNETGLEPTNVERGLATHGAVGRVDPAAWLISRGLKMSPKRRMGLGTPCALAQAWLIQLRPALTWIVSALAWAAQNR